MRSDEVIFDWDEANRSHLAAHGLLPEQAEEVLLNAPIFLKIELRNGESRTTYLGATLGATDASILLLVVTTPRRGRVRVVTAWKANRKWRQLWQAENESPSH